MKRKSFIVGAFIVIVLIAGFLLKSVLQDPWETWVNKQTNLVVKYETEGASKEERNLFREEARALLEKEAAGLRHILSKPPPLKRMPFRDEAPPEQYYDGPWPQTPESVMAAFDGDFSIGEPENAEWDLAYPRAEWISRLLERGVIFETLFEYSALMIVRGELLLDKDDPDTWASGDFGVEPAEDWETYQDNYIDRQIWSVQELSTAMKADPNVDGGTFMGPGDSVFLPTTPNRLYVDRTSFDTIFTYGVEISKTEELLLTFAGIEPEGVEVIYIDDEKGIFLDEEPPPLSWEAILEKSGPPPPGWEDNLPEGWDPSPELIEAINNKFKVSDTASPPLSDDPTIPPESVSQNEQIEESPQDTLEFTQEEEEFLEWLTEYETGLESDFDLELERFLTQEGVVVPSDADFKKIMREKFETEVLNPIILNEVMETLERDGLTEGFRRLQNEDPEMAKVIAELLGARRPLRKSQRYTPSPKPPKPEED